MPVEPNGLNIYRPPAPIERPTPPVGEPVDTEEHEPGSFTTRITDAINQVNDMQQRANQEAENIATGQAENLQQAVVALEKADLALELTVRVTENAVQAYREISNMQI